MTEWKQLNFVVLLLAGDSGSGGRGVVQQSSPSVLEQDTEPPTAPDAQVGTLDSSLRHRCVNG